MKHIKTRIILLTFILLPNLFAGNPLIPDVGMADPHMYVFDGELYLFSSRDSSKISKSFIMPDWNIWTSDNMIDWKLVHTIKPTDTWMGESTRCWATESAYRSGKYYFYFSNGNESTGVLVADAPKGPYVDVLGKPLLASDLTPIKEYDPGLLIDDDGSAYMVFGHYRSDDPDYYYMIVKLNKDMISLAEAPREIKITGELDVLIGNDKPNLHKKTGLYYLSAGSHYATSKHVYGPYERNGNSGNGSYGLDSRAHGNYFDWNNQSFHTWCYFYLGKKVARYRESYLSYLHYKDNGEMVTDTDFLDQHFSTGVGQYDANWESIQAEWFMSADKMEKKESPNGGFEIQQLKNKSSLYYPNMRNLDEQKSISFHVSSEKGGTIEIYAGKDKKQKLGVCDVSATGGFNTYHNVSCKLDNASSVDLTLVFKGKGKDIMHLDWFKFLH